METLEGILPNDTSNISFPNGAELKLIPDILILKVLIFLTIGPCKMPIASTFQSGIMLMIEICGFRLYSTSFSSRKFILFIMIV